MRSTRPSSSLTHTEPKPTASRTGIPPTGSLAARCPVRGSMRSMLAEPRTATHTEPYARATPTGWGSANSAVTLFARGSILATESLQPPPADQTPLSPAATKPHGPYASLMLVATLLVPGSTRTILLPLGTATQSASRPAIRLMCSEQQKSFGPKRIVATTRLVAGSIRVTLGPPASAIQTAPGETATPDGCGPTWIVALTLLAVGSMRETASSDGCVSQTAPSPAAAASPGETLMRATTAFCLGSIFMSVDSVSLIAQTAPSPTAKAPPCGGTGILAMTLPARPSACAFAAAVWPLLAVTARGGSAPEVALTRVSVLEAKLLIQTELPAGATVRAGAAFAGGATRICGPAAFPDRSSIRLTVPWTASPANT